jgi:hypothetical protein
MSDEFEIVARAADAPIGAVVAFDVKGTRVAVVQRSLRDETVLPDLV